MKREDVSVVIRAAGERTVDLCRELVLEQVPERNVFVINEVPFARAVRRTFEIGVENDLPWTVAVDADILLAEHAIPQAMALAEKADGNIFKFNGLLVDKFFGSRRYICPHIYRTSLCKMALDDFPEGNSIRPEMAVVSRMAEKHGHPWATLDCMLGVHDFEQYYGDIFRKAFVHANKFEENTVYRFLRFWSQEADKDDDFKVALAGLCLGLAHKGEIEIDRNTLPTNYRDHGLLSSLNEKGPMLDGSWSDGRKVREYVARFVYARAHPTLSELRDITSQSNFSKMIPKIIGVILRNLGERVLRRENE